MDLNPPESDESVSIAGGKPPDGKSIGGRLHAAAKRLRLSYPSDQSNNLPTLFDLSPKLPLMSHEERRKVIEAPMPTFNVYGPQGGHGGVELPGLPYDNERGEMVWIGMNELYRGKRKPALNHYDGEDAFVDSPFNRSE